MLRLLVLAILAGAADCYAAHDRSQLRPTVDVRERVDRYHDHDQLFFDINDQLQLPL